jgi:hypothetical protein
MLPTFVGGFRSGSTLLINLLGLHPSISAWYETKCLCEPLRWMKVLNGSSPADLEAQLAMPRGISGFTADAVAKRMRLDMEYTAARLSGRIANGKAAHERYPLGADNIRYGLDAALSHLNRWREELGDGSYEALSKATAHLIEGLGSVHLGGQKGLKLVNKTPEIPRFGAELRAGLGPCLIVNLIRDGREVAASAAGLNWGDPYRMAAMWEGLIRQSRAAAQEDPGHYLEVRFEDLLDRPIATIDRVFRFLEIEPQGADVVRAYELRANTSIAPASRAHDPAARASLDQMPASARELLTELGYIDNRGAAPMPCEARRLGRLSRWLRRSVLARNR